MYCTLCHVITHLSRALEVLPSVPVPENEVHVFGYAQYFLCNMAIFHVKRTLSCALEVLPSPPVLETGVLPLR